MACCFCRCVRIPDAVTRRRKNLVRHYMNWRICVGKGCFTWLKSVPSSAFPKDRSWKTTLMNLSPFIHISEVSVVTIRVARSVQMFVTLLLRQAVSLEERLIENTTVLEGCKSILRFGRRHWYSHEQNSPLSNSFPGFPDRCILLT